MGSPSAVPNLESRISSLDAYRSLLPRIKYTPTTNVPASITTLNAVLIHGANRGKRPVITSAAGIKTRAVQISRARRRRCRVICHPRSERVEARLFFSSLAILDQLSQ